MRSTAIFLILCLILGSCAASSVSSTPNGRPRMRRGPTRRDSASADVVEGTTPAAAAANAAAEPVCVVLSDTDQPLEKEKEKHIVPKNRTLGDHEDRPVIIGICGGTGSGKTTLTAAILERMGASNVTVISHDSYYRDLSHLTFDERAEVNFDHPDSLDSGLLKSHIRTLKAGHHIDVPVYDFTTHSRTAETVVVEPKKIVLIDGILIFAEEGVKEELDMKIFVHTDDDIRLIRRLQRDTLERARTVASVIEQYKKTVRPMHSLFVEPSKQFADIIVPAGDGIQEAAVDTVVSRLMEIVRTHDERLSISAVSEVSGAAGAAGAISAGAGGERGGDVSGFSGVSGTTVEEKKGEGAAGRGREST